MPVYGIDSERLEKLAEALALFFYLLMFMALVTALAGSAGSGFLLLVIGSCAHVARAALVEFVDREERPRDQRPSPERPERPARTDREAERRRSARRAVA